jgi:class 3 adenylate cyclase
LIAYQPIAIYDPRHQRGEFPLAREQRKLAAILAADVVGYSRLMGRDQTVGLQGRSRHVLIKLISKVAGKLDWKPRGQVAR